MACLRVSLSFRLYSIWPAAAQWLPLVYRHYVSGSVSKLSPCSVFSANDCLCCKRVVSASQAEQWLPVFSVITFRVVTTPRCPRSVPVQYCFVLAWLCSDIFFLLIQHYSGLVHRVLLLFVAVVVKHSKLCDRLHVVYLCMCCVVPLCVMWCASV